MQVSRGTTQTIPEELDVVPYCKYEHDSDFLYSVTWASALEIIGISKITTSPLIAVCAIAGGVFFYFAAKRALDDTQECWKKERRLSHINNSSIGLYLHLGEQFFSSEKLHFIKSVEKTGLIAVQRSIKPSQIPTIINFLKSQNNQIKLLWLNLGDEYLWNHNKLLKELEDMRITSIFESLSIDHPHYVVASQAKIENFTKRFLLLLPENSRLSAPADKAFKCPYIASLSYEIDPRTLDVSFYKRFIDKNNIKATYRAGHAESEVLNI